MDSAGFQGTSRVDKGTSNLSSLAGISSSSSLVGTSSLSSLILQVFLN